MEKECVECKEKKPINEFWKFRYSKDGYSCYCKACAYKRTRKYVVNNQEKRNIYNRTWRKNRVDSFPQLIYRTMKICSKCKNEKLVTEFHKRKESADGLRGMCKNCENPIKNKSAEKYKNQKRVKERIRKERYPEKYKEKVKKWNIISKERKKQWFEEDMKRNPEKYKKKFLMEAQQMKRQRDELLDGYVVSDIKQNSTLTREIIRQYPDLIDAYRQIIKIKRLCKQSSISETT